MTYDQLNDRPPRGMERAARFEDDPDWLLARAVYLYPDADDTAGRDVTRVEAVLEMHAIEGRYESRA
jgi:hypothetical protein